MDFAAKKKSGMTGDMFSSALKVQGRICQDGSKCGLPKSPCKCVSLRLPGGVYVGANI